MAETPRLDLPYIGMSQAQKEVTHNLSLDILDAIVQASVKDRDLATPPGTPVTGDTYIVAASPTGAWVGHATHIAQWISVQWKFSVPLEGWLVYVQDEDVYVFFNGTAWQVFSGGAGSNFLALSDTPDSYTGQANKVVSVNAGATALEFTTPSAGVSTFTALTDTPDAYTGQAGQFVKVNGGATALEFGAGSTGTFLNLSDTPDSYSGQNGKVVSVKSDATGVEFITPAGGTLGLHRGALLELAAAHTIPDVTATLIPWGTVIYDTNSVWSVSQPTRLTVPAGMDKVIVQAQLEMTSAGSGGLSLRLLKNGSTVAGQAAMRQPIETSTIPAAAVILSVMTPPLAVTAGDYFELEVLQNSGTALAAVEGATSWMTMVIISPATAGASSFLALTDTPDAYAGQAGKAVLVNAGATALEFGTAGAGTFLALSDTPDAYSGEGGKVVAVKTDASGLEFITAPGGGGGTSITNDGARVVRTTPSASIANTTLAVVTFESETLDQAGYWAIGQPTRLTIPQTGWYTLSAQITWNTSVNSGFRDVNVRVNGTDYRIVSRVAATGTTTSGDQLATGLAYLTAGDYLEVVVFHSASGSSTVTGAASIMRAGGGAVATYLGLTDTPDTYTGQGGKVVQVNAGATATEFGPVLGTLATQNANAVAITGGSATLSALAAGDVTCTGSMGVGGSAPGSNALRVFGTLGVQQVPSSLIVAYLGHHKASQWGLMIAALDTDTGQPAIIFQNVATSFVGSITTTATATAYNTSSDARLKHAIAPLTGSLDVIAALNPISHRWNVDDSYAENFLAHELQRVLAYAVTGEPDAVNEDGSVRPQQVDVGKCVPRIVGAIKELLARVEALTARVANLEAQLGL